MPVEFPGESETVQELPALAHQSLGRRAASGAMWITFENLGVQGTSFAVFAVLAHFVSASDFGLISISFAIIFSLRSLMLDTVCSAVTTLQNATAEEYTTTFWMAFILGAFSCAAIALSAPFLEIVFHAEGLTNVLRRMSVIALFQGLSATHESWMWRHFLFRSLAFRAISGAIVGGAVGVTLAIKGFGVEALVIQQVVTALVSLALLWISTPWRPKFTFSIAAARQIFAFVRQVFPNSIMYVINQNADTVLVTFFFGTAGTGLYNVAKRVTFAIRTVAHGPISKVSRATFADIQSDIPRVRQVLVKAITVSCVISAPIFLGISAVASHTITLLFGAKWVTAVPSLEILCVGGLIAILLEFNDNIFLTQQRPRWTVYVSGSYTLLAVAAFITVSHSSMRFLALPFVLPYLIVLPLSVLLVSRRTGLSFRDWLAAAFPGLASAAVMFAAVRFASKFLTGFGDMGHLAILCPLGVIVYIATISLIARDTTMMIFTRVRDFMRRRIRKA